MTNPTNHPTPTVRPCLHSGSRAHCTICHAFPEATVEAEKLPAEPGGNADNGHRRDCYCWACS